MFYHRCESASLKQSLSWDYFTVARNDQYLSTYLKRFLELIT